MESADKPGSVEDDHSSGTPVTGRLVRPTRRHLRAAGCQRRVSLFGLAPEGVCHAVCVAAAAVGSYPTVSPLPVRRTNPAPSAVCFLLHFPSARAAQALPGLLPCGARTFLHHLAVTAIVWPTPGTTVGEGQRTGKTLGALSRNQGQLRWVPRCGSTTTAAQHRCPTHYPRLCQQGRKTRDPGRVNDGSSRGSTKVIRAPAPGHADKRGFSSRR